MFGGEFCIGMDGGERHTAEPLASVLEQEKTLLTYLFNCQDNNILAARRRAVNNER